MKKVLIIGAENDPHCLKIGKLLMGKGHNPAYLYVDHFPLSGELSANILDSGICQVTLNCNKEMLDLGTIHSVYCRPYPNDVFNIKHSSRIVERFLHRECYALLKMIWEVMRSEEYFWINPWSASEIAENKGLQMKLAASLGLRVPETLITSSREVATSFIKKMKDAGRKVVLKTITGFRNQESGERGGAFVTVIDEGGLGGQNYPVVLQEYIDKEYEVRVTVVGEKVFSCKITSQNSPNEATKTDWRVYDFSNVKFMPTSLPIELEKKFVDLNRLLGLNYSAIDMVCEPNGSFRFLELNPNGLWLWIEELAGLPITNAIADLLIKSD